MSKSRLIAFSLITAIIVALTIIVFSQQSLKSEFAKQALLFPNLKQQLNEVQSLTIEHQDAPALTIKREASAWIIQQPKVYPADLIKVRNLLLELAEADLFEAKTSNPDKYKDLGVEDIAQDGSASYKVSIGFTDGQTKSVIIGDYKLKKGTYIRLADQAQSWLSPKKLIVSNQFMDWAERKFLPFPESNIQQVDITPQEGTAYQLMRDGKEALFVLKAIDADAKETNQTFAKSVASGLETAMFDDVAAKGEIPVPATYNTAIYQTFDGKQIALTLWKDGNKGYIQLAESGDTKLDEPLMSHLDKWVFTVPAYQVDKILKPIADFDKQ